MRDKPFPTAVAVTRRDALLRLTAAGGALFAGRLTAQSVTPGNTEQTPPVCIITPEQTEGPFFVDERLRRSNLRLDPTDGSTLPGVPLSLMLRFAAVDGTACAPLPVGAVVDLWHCDARGIYSDVDGLGNTDKNFLRGYQTTDAAGVVRFETIYPGWYPGRTVHIHFKVRTPTGARRRYELTSQLYFDDSITDRVFARDTYASRGPRSVRNSRDGIFRQNGGRLLLSLTEGEGGYAGTFDVGLRTG